MDHLMNTYKRLPINFDHGNGVYLYDNEGNKYLDAHGGIAVSVLGHAHPKVTEAIQKQAAKVIHVSNLYQIENQTLLANDLCKHSGLDRVFFNNSGAEAVETALKLCRLYGHQQEIDFPHIIVAKNAFHGRTLATLSAGGNHKTQAGFEPLVKGFIRVPFNDINALEETAKQYDNIAAVLIEPIQGEGGVKVPHKDYLARVREVCDKYQWLMVLDEVQTGMGRTGTLFTYQAKNIMPDILCLAKGLANGVPVGACLATERVSDLFQPGKHGSTFGGNPLSMAAGLATLLEITTKKWWENAKTLGEYLITGLKDRLKSQPIVVDIRGQGFMIGIELDRPCRSILNIGLKNRLLFNVTSDKVVRLLPPLIMEKSHIDEILVKLPTIIEEFALETKS